MRRTSRADLLITLESAASIGPVIWHFFVPTMWDWGSYIDKSATELIVAVRAINVFFSLSLVLFGLMNLLMVHGPRTSRHAAPVVLGPTCLLWLVRVVMQLVYPQGSMNPITRYGLLLLFASVLACQSVPLVLMMARKDGSDPFGT